MIEEDFDAFFADHGVLCVCNGTEFMGIKDSTDEDVGSSGMNSQANLVTLLVLSSVVQSNGIKNGVVITVDSVDYTARNPARQDDGAFTLIPLTKRKL